MAHFALLCLPFYSHLRLFEAVAAALRSRGHAVSLVLNRGGGQFVIDPSLRVFEVGVTPGRRRDLDAIIHRAAKPTGVMGILRTVADTAAMTEAFCRDGPSLFERIGADAIIGDQMEPAAGLIADALGLPFASIASALPINRAPGIPLPFLDWPFDPSEEGRRRAEGGEKVARLLLGRQNRTIQKWSRILGVGERAELGDCLSPLAQIAQTVPSFDFPRPTGGPLHAVGPIRLPRRGAPAGPAIRLDEKRPVIYASLGTLQGHRLSLFKKIAAACRPLDVSLVISHCGGLTARQAAGIDATHVTAFLDQHAIVQRASVCITHAGLNTVLDSLGAGTPVLALPIAFDQRGVGARIAFHGVGANVRHDRVSVSALTDDISRLMNDPSYRQNAEPIRQELARSNGLRDAVAHIEKLVTTPTAKPRKLEAAFA